MTLIDVDNYSYIVGGFVFADYRRNIIYGLTQVVSYTFLTRNTMVMN